MKLRLTDIEVDRTLDVRVAIDPTVVDRYAEILELLPPVVVFDIDGIRLLADGFHRVAAANKRGDRTVEGVVKQGTREDAMAWAATANAKHGFPLTKQERHEAIKRLLGLKWPQRRIAAEIGCDEETVGYVGKFTAVKSEVGEVDGLTGAHYHELAQAPPKRRKRLAKTAAEQGWTSKEVRTAGKALSSEALTEDDKDAIERGELPPMEVEENGRLVFTPETVGRLKKQASEADVITPMLRMVAALPDAEKRWTDDALQNSHPTERNTFAREAPRMVAFWARVEKALSESSRLKVVS